MKKSLIILALSLLQCACATPEAAPVGAASRLGFEAISAEITVSYVETETADDLSQTVAQNIEK
jgi:hypothetical protein